MFHVSQLKRALSSTDLCHPLSPILANDLEWLVEPDQWKGLPQFKASWELVDTTKEHFPDFHLKDKVSHIEGEPVANNSTVLSPVSESPVSPNTPYSNTQNQINAMKQKVVIKVAMNGQKSRTKALKIAVGVSGVESAALKGQEKDEIEVTGEEIDVVALTFLLRKNVGNAEVVSVGAAEKKEQKKEEKKEEQKMSQLYTPGIHIRMRLVLLTTQFTITRNTPTDRTHAPSCKEIDALQLQLHKPHGRSSCHWVVSYIFKDRNNPPCPTR
ncbi:Heavy metal-associated isoprenylated plant protein 16 [Vitis vinifera]|uniref:Heavy metal-associated isoprenylated plant protein 16 n=1 Tax=Vitis vinifera TaxID=29760 RepID=A0A438EES4_VITVI|nr:Heavy metal-associated isoprenylated plant protein 16 [Vitis vinifera]